MHKKLLLFPATLILGGLVLTGCTAAGDATDAKASVLAGDLMPTEVMADNADYTTVNLDEWDEADAVDIALSGSGSTGGGSAVVSTAGTVTISQAGVYRLVGSLTGGIVVAAPDDAQVVLILDGASMTNEAGAAIDVQSGDDVAIHLAEGSTNSVSDAASYAEDADANAAISARADLTVSGSGALTVTGNGGHGIKSTKDLVILDGDITVTAAEDALRGKDALVVEGGSLALTATAGDGMKSKGDDADGASAGSDATAIDWTRGYTYIRGGSIDITAGDDGIQSFTDTVITGGTVTVSAVDDGIKAEAIVSIGETAGIEAPVVTVAKSNEGLEAANVAIGGGTVSVTASDDGINASGNAELQARIAGEEYVKTEDGAVGEGMGEPPAMPEGVADAGERPEPPAGAEGMAAGERPEGMPVPPADGEMPEMPAGGEMPEGMAAGGPGGAGGGAFQSSGERLEISGGEVTVDAEGDGLDSNGDLTISGGSTVVYGPTRGGNGSLDSNGELTISGGTLATFGPNSMEETPTAGDTGWVLVAGAFAAGESADLVDADGNVITTLVSRKAAANIIFASSEITAGDTYTLVRDGETIGTGVAGEASKTAMGGGGRPGAAAGDAATDQTAEETPAG